jgi:hypothetical protein
MREPEPKFTHFSNLAPSDLPTAQSISVSLPRSSKADGGTYLKRPVTFPNAMDTSS